MPYHVDQSGKIEHGRGPTVLALANDSAYTLCISAREKRLATRTLQVHYDRKAVTVWLFAAALYYVLIELPRGATATVDIEYPGHGRYIKAVLLTWLQQERPDITANHIVFGLVGKKSRAHKHALAVRQGEAKADRILKADDLLRKIIGP